MTLDYSRHRHIFQLSCHWEEAFKFVDLRNRLIRLIFGFSDFGVQLSTANFNQKPFSTGPGHCPWLYHRDSMYFGHSKYIHKYHAVLCSYCMPDALIHVLDAVSHPSHAIPARTQMSFHQVLCRWRLYSLCDK